MKKRREKGLFTPLNVSLSFLSMNTIQTKKRTSTKRKKKYKRSMSMSLKHYLFTCWSCSYKELLIAAFLKRTFCFLPLLFLSWNKWDTNIMWIFISVRAKNAILLYRLCMQLTVDINFDIGTNWQKVDMYTLYTYVF